MATRRGGRSADHEAEHSRDRVTTDDELDIDADGDGSQLDVDVEEEEAQLLAQPSIGPVASATNKADSSTATSAIVETRYSRPSTLGFAVGLVILATILGFFAAGHLETLDLAAIRDGITVNETVVSSPADERKFQWFTLGSGIEILVVSDTAATRAAAAVDVHVGSWADPVEFPGLAHFLEHMLFLGTEKYPQENEYNSFLSAHGGGSNAYTDSEHTNYHFHVSADALEGALDRFSQFFIAPMFNASSTQREMKAVDSEHRKNLNSDGWRAYQLLKEAANPASPFHSFSTGDIDTLDKPGIRATLLAFHGLHYTAPRMRACIIGKEPVSQLRRWAAKYLGPVPAVSPLGDVHPRGHSAAGRRLLSEAGSSDALAPSSEDVGLNVDLGQIASVIADLPGGAIASPAVYRRPAAASTSDNTAAGSERAPQRSDRPAPGPATAFQSRRLEALTGPYATVNSSELDDGIQRVRSAFARVMSSTGHATVYPSTSDFRGRLLVLKPVEQSHSLTLLWPLWSVADPDSQRVSGVEYVSSLLGDESRGSILSFLRRRGLAETVSSGLEIDSTGFSMLQVSIQISPLAIAAATDAGNAAAAAAQGIAESSETSVAAARENATATALMVICESIMSSVFSFVDAVDGGVSGAVVSGLQDLRRTPGAEQQFSDAAIGFSILEASAPLIRSALPLDAPPVSGAPAGTFAIDTEAPKLLRSPSSATSDLISWPNALDAAYDIWTEQKEVAEIGFRYPIRGDAASTASGLARAMHTSTPSQILGSPSQAVWQPHHAMKTARALVPSNTIAMLETSLLPLPSSLPLAKTEPIYGTKYASLLLSSVHRITDAAPAVLSESIRNAITVTQHQLRNAMSIPRRTSFIPTSFDLVHFEGYANDIGIPLNIPKSRSGDGSVVSGGTTAQDIWAASKVQPMLLDVNHSNHQVFAEAFPAHVVPSVAIPTLMAWWMPDRYFGWPRSFVSVEVLSLPARDSPSAAILTQLFADCAMEELNEELYLIAKGGTSISFAPLSFASGFQVSFSGYSAVALRVIEFWFAGLKTSGGLKQDCLSSKLLLIVDGIRNGAFDQPYKRASYYHGRLTGSARFSEQQLLTAASELAGLGSGWPGIASSAVPFVVPDASGLLEKLTTHVMRLFANVAAVQMLVSGNEDIARAEAITSAILKPLYLSIAGAAKDPNSTAPAAAAVSGFASSLAVAPGSTSLLQMDAANAADINSAVYTVYQLGLRDNCNATTAVAEWSSTSSSGGSASNVDGWSCSRRAAAFDVLANLIYEPAFDELRTKQQLGYIVSAGGKPVGTAIDLIGATGGSGAWSVATGKSNAACATEDASGAFASPCVKVKTLTRSATDAVSSDGLSGVRSKLAVQSIGLLPIGDAMLSLVVLIQGTTQPAHVQDERGATFMLQSFRTFLRDLPESAIASAVSALRAQVTRVPTSPSEVHEWAWGEIASHSYRFDRSTASDAALASITKKDLVDLYEHMVHNRVKRVSVEVYGSGVARGIPGGDATATLVQLH